MRNLFIVLLALFFSHSLSAQETYWSPVNESALDYNPFSGNIKPASYRLFKLNEAMMKSKLATAPSERSVSPSKSDFVVTLPVSDGKLEQFRIVDAPVMDAQLAAKYPGIRSYSGVSLNDPSITVRFSVSSQGFNAMVLSTGRNTIYIDPAITGKKKDNLYLVVTRKDVADYRQPFSCLTEEFKPKTTAISSSRLAADDGKLRTYRLALTSSGEYSQFWLDGSETSDAERKAKVLAAMNSQMTRANAIFERDFGVRLVLIANNDALIYLNSSTDPFGTTSSSWNTQAQSTIDGVIGSANYDIGHFVHRGPTNNGNAGCIGCVCTAGSKGKGWTSYINLGNQEYFVVDYLTHEMGHQLGGNHTFTHSYEGTIAQVEPGSGSSIMGYAGITGVTTDVQPHSDDYFHSITIQQVSTYIKSTAGGCAVVTVTGNTAPTVNAGADYVIPKSTPFTLTGTGSDANGDALTFNWEQIDARTSGSPTTPSATATAGPVFRSYQPSTSTSRTFPQLSSILSGANGNTWEVLPSVARTLNFRFSAKDNRSGGGNANTDDAVVTVNGTAGPFAVTAPNTATYWLSGSSATVTWSVNSTNLSPINCANVKISLSTDGGLTFPVVLSTSTANDGSEVVSVPAVLSTTCRVKVEAVGNIFFDISNIDFTITDTPPPCTAPATASATTITATSATLTWTAVSGAASYTVDYKTNASSTWINAATATTATSVNVPGLTAATLYDFRVSTNCIGSSSDYTQSQFTTAAAPTCPGVYDVSTNGTLAGAAQIPLNTDVKGLINVTGDADYYKFVISVGGTATVTLTTLPANYNLRIYNSAGSLLASSTNSGTTNESIARTYTAGTYYALVSGQNSSAFNASNCYTLKVTTGTASREGKDPLQTGNTFRMSLYPNPAGNILNVILGESSEQRTIQIIDVNGRQVINRMVIQNANNINIQTLSNGVYFLKVTDASGNVLESQKFVKQ